MDESVLAFDKIYARRCPNKPVRVSLMETEQRFIKLEEMRLNFGV